MSKSEMKRQNIQRGRPMGDGTMSEFKVRSFEDLYDVDRYLFSAIAELNIPAEFKGTITFKLSYEEYKEKNDE